MFVLGWAALASAAEADCSQTALPHYEQDVGELNGKDVVLHLLPRVDENGRKGLDVCADVGGTMAPLGRMRHCTMRRATIASSKLEVVWHCDPKGQTEWGSRLTQSWKAEGEGLSLSAFATEVDEFEVVRDGVKAHLDAGEFGPAYAMVASHRVRLRRDGTDTARRREIMDLFLAATHREAKTAHEAGEIDKAAGHVRFLFAYPPVEDSHVENRISIQLYAGPQMSAEPTEANIAYVSDFGRYMNAAGFHEEAVEILEQVVKLSPELAPARLSLADALWPLDMRSEAKAHYTRFQELSGKGAELPERVARRLE